MMSASIPFRSATVACSPAGECVSATRTRSRGPNSFDSNIRVLCCSHTHIQVRNHISAPAEPDAERNNRLSRAVPCRVVVPGTQAAMRISALRRGSVEVAHKSGLRSRSQARPNQRPMRQPLKTLKRLLRDRELYS
jgi:hypothetical protein